MLQETERGFVPILITVVVSVILGAGTTYITFVNLNKQETRQDTEATKVTPVEEVPGVSTSTEIGETTPNTEQHTQSATVVEVKKTTSLTPSIVTPVVDVCSNIEGVQTSVPVGYSLESGNCVIPQTTDLCPNLAGIQAEIPQGRHLYRNTNECLTVAEINDIENAVQALNQEEAQCREVKEQAVSIAQQKQLALQEHNEIVAEIQLNKSGMSRSGAASEIQREDARYRVIEDTLNAQLTSVNYEVRLYCN